MDFVDSPVGDLRPQDCRARGLEDTGHGMCFTLMFPPLCKKKQLGVHGINHLLEIADISKSGCRVQPLHESRSFEMLKSHKSRSLMDFVLSIQYLPGH